MEPILSEDLVNRMIVVNKLFNPRNDPLIHTGLVLVVIEQHNHPGDKVKVISNGYPTDVVLGILRGIVNDMEEHGVTPPRERFS